MNPIRERGGAWKMAEERGSISRDSVTPHGIRRRICSGLRSQISLSHRRSSDRLEDRPECPGWRATWPTPPYSSHPSTLSWSRAI
jgi:hypothetical protein